MLTRSMRVHLARNQPQNCCIQADRNCKFENRISNTAANRKVSRNHLGCQKVLQEGYNMRQ